MLKYNFHSPLNNCAMQKIKMQLVIAKNDYETIMMNLKSRNGKATFNQYDAKELEAELKKATLVNNDDLPQDVVRLNSCVTIKDEKENKIMELMVVTPDKANIKQRKISILSPIGTALIGYKKGKRVRWKVPAGKKIFTILDVRYPMA
jgi:regulator of nucleoside diphosphate kinase